MPRILVIDDDDQVRQLIRRFLERAGFEVDDAGDPVVGLQMARTEPPDVLITDILMPEKDGLEIIRELHQEIPEVEILAISGGAQSGPETYLPPARALGAVRTLAKPFTQEQLLEAVAGLLNEPDRSS
jgi:CheY-like chemotaxis protein